MGMFCDMLDEGMRETQRIMKRRGVPYEEARRIIIEECSACEGTGWQGHGMGGDTCGSCNGTGKKRKI